MFYCFVEGFRGILVHTRYNFLVLCENRSFYPLSIWADGDVRTGLCQRSFASQVDRPYWPLRLFLLIYFCLKLVNFIYLLVECIWIAPALLLPLAGSYLVKLLWLRDFEGSCSSAPLFIEFWRGISKSELVKQFWIRHIPQRRHAPITDTFIVGVVVGRARTPLLLLVKTR